MILALIALLALSAFISASETSLFSLSPLSLKSYRTENNPRLRLIAQVMDRPADLLVTLLICNVLANILVQNVVSNLFDRIPNWGLRVGVPLALTLILGEVLPKTLALPRNVAIAKRVIRPIFWISRLLSPIRSRLTALTSVLTRFLFFFLRRETAMNSEELRHLLDASRQRGIVGEEEAHLAEGALNIEERSVKELMRPREEILYYDIEEPLDQLIHLFADEELSRVPVVQGSIDQVLGVLSVKRAFYHQNRLKKGSDLIPLVKEAYFVPETMGGAALLRELRRRNESIALVVDEYGVVSGLVTDEDLYEAVVGEISDRRDAESLFMRAGPDVIITSGKLELTAFEEIFGVALPKSHNVTLAGYLIEQIGDIPTPGTRYTFHGFLFLIVAADPNRIRRIYVRRLPP